MESAISPDHAHLLFCRTTALVYCEISSKQHQYLEDIKETVKTGMKLCQFYYNHYIANTSERQETALTQNTSNIAASHISIL